TPLTTVIAGPRCRLSVTPPVLASSDARSRSALLRFLTASRPTTSPRGSEPPAPKAVVVGDGAFEDAATGNAVGLAMRFLAFALDGACGLVWATICETERSAGSRGKSADETWTTGATGAGRCDGAGCRAAGGGSDGVSACILATSSA